MKWASAIAAAAMAAAAFATPAQAGDRGDAALAGGVAGFVGGLIVGNALSHPAPPPRTIYVEEGAPVAYCHWGNGPRYWDGYEGVWRHRRVRVCD